MLSFNMQASSVFNRFKLGFACENIERQILLGTGEKLKKNRKCSIQYKNTKKGCQNWHPFFSELRETNFLFNDG
jgi:hypothetical protein